MSEKKTMQSMDYKSLTILLKTKHLSLEECAELYGMTPEEFETKVRKNFCKKTANQFIREMKSNKSKAKRNGRNVETEVVETVAEKETVTEVTIETTVETTAEATTETTVEATTETTAEATTETTAEVTTETTTETLEQLQENLAGKRQLLCSLEIEQKTYQTNNNTITKKLADAKVSLEKLLSELKSAQMQTESLLNSLESNRQQIAITKSMIAETRKEITQLEEKISDMSFIRVTCGNASEIGTAEESQFEIPESSVKAKLMVLFDEPFMATLSIEQAKAVARYLVLVEAVKSSWGKEVKLIFSDESSCVAILLSEHFGIATEVI